MGHSFDIVAYTYKADIYCPADTIQMLVDDGIAAPAALWDMSPEEALDQIAGSLAIARDDEHSFDSDEFPKVVFRDQLEDEEHCGKCHGELS